MQKKLKDFFVSYNSADRSWGEWIAWHLEAAGYTTVLQAWDFRPASNFVIYIQHALSVTKRIIAVLSPDYLTSLFAQAEWATAFAKDPTGKKGLLLPVRVRECEPEGLLSQIVSIDIFALPEQEAIDVLRAGVIPGRVKPASKPALPGSPKRPATQKPRFPGTLPPIWNVPYNRNPNFTGRVQLLDGLRKALTSGQPAALTQAMYGLGGVGKTQTAVEYVYRFQKEYEVVWWIRADEATTLAVDYAALASALGLPEKNASEQSAIIQAVRRWLDQHGGNWLLVFDNAKGIRDVHKYLPQSSTGHVIITSRNPNWRGVVSALPVELMKRKEAVNLLLKRTGETDKRAASKLAKALGDLPLALEQAGAYIEETVCSFDDYLEIFRTHLELSGADPSADYNATVATTWKVSFEQVKIESPEAEHLLSLCAFLAPDKIPLHDILSKGKQHLPKSLAKASKNPEAFLKVVAALRRYSLVKLSTNRLLSVHRLVQAVGRARLEEKDMKTWASIAVLLLSEAFQFDSADVRTWPACSTLLPHALAATEHAKELQVAYEATSRLLTAVGKYSVGRAVFPKVKAAFEQALALDKGIHGPNHSTVAEDAKNLGFLLKNQGDLSGAREYFEQALKVNLKARVPGHPETAVSRNNLGIMLKDLGDLKGAQKEFKLALRINRKWYGTEHPEVALNLNNLGYLLKDKGDMKGAQEFFERALSINEAAYGVNHLSVATNLNNLGIILKDKKDKGDTERARAYFERALKISEDSYGPNHPEVATNLNNLGYLMRDKGELEDARVYFERALSINKAAYGIDHPNVASTLKNLDSLKKKKVISEGAQA